MNGRKGTEGEDTNPKTLQLTFGSAKALAALCLPSTIFQTARVVEWQTRTFEGRMPKGMRVQVPPRAPSCCLGGNPKSRVRYSMNEVIGHARDRKNEQPLRINFFHPNDLAARSKRTGDAQPGPRAINSVFGFFLSNLDCQRLPVVGIKQGPTSRPE